MELSSRRNRLFGQYQSRKLQKGLKREKKMKDKTFCLHENNLKNCISNPRWIKICICSYFQCLRRDQTPRGYVSSIFVDSAVHLKSNNSGWPNLLLFLRHTKSRVPAITIHSTSREQAFAFDKYRISN